MGDKLGGDLGGRVDCLGSGEGIEKTGAEWDCTLGGHSCVGEEGNEWDCILGERNKFEGGEGGSIGGELGAGGELDAGELKGGEWGLGGLCEVGNNPGGIAG